MGFVNVSTKTAFFIMTAFKLVLFPLVFPQDLVIVLDLMTLHGQNHIAKLFVRRFKRSAFWFWMKTIQPSTAGVCTLVRVVTHLVMRRFTIQQLETVSVLIHALTCVHKQEKGGTSILRQSNVIVIWIVIFLQFRTFSINLPMPDKCVNLICSRMEHAPTTVIVP